MLAAHAKLASAVLAMPEIDNAFWDHAVLRSSAALHDLTLGGSALLFDAASQQLYEQNATSAAVWRAVQESGTIHRAACALAGDSGHRETVLDHARSAVREWLRLGFLRPEVLRDNPQGRVPIRLGWQGRTLEVRLGGDLDHQSLAKVFEPFAVREEPDRWIAFQELHGLVFMTDDRGRCAARQSDEVIPEVKAVFTEAVVASATTGFLAHAALLSRGGRGVMICGEPGAGKSTLSMSLIMAGYTYLSDDVVWISDQGEVTGVPFAPAVKEGAWRLLDEMECDLPTSAAYLRGDGQRVRYVLDRPVQAAPVYVQSVILLERRGDGPPRLEPVSGIEVLKTILGSAYAARGAISAATLEALVRRIETMRAARLHASGWRDDLRLVEQFVT